MATRATSDEKAVDTHEAIDEQQHAGHKSLENTVVQKPPQLKATASSKSEHVQTSDSKKEDSSQTLEEKSKAGVGDYFRVFQYTDLQGRLLYAIGITCAVASGAALPLMTLVFGSSTGSISNYGSGQGGDSQQFQASIHGLVLWFVYLFVGRFVIGYFGTLCMCIAAARTTNALRKAFLASLLRQDMAHFDLQGNGSVATQTTTNGNRINQGIAEKLYTCVVGLSLFFSAFIVALAVQWKLALITMSIVPGMMLAVGSCIGVVTPIENEIVRLYSRAATVAQDALGSMKTILAFGAQEKIVTLYDEYLRAAYDKGKKKSVMFGILFSSQNFFTISGMSLAFWEGSRLYQSGEIPNVSKVITVILSVTLGTTSVLFFLPQIESITNASSAAAELFSIVDKPSQLDPLDSAGRRPTSCTGDIEIRDLHFAYPSRPEAPVLQGLNLRIPANKTTALVGPSGCGKSTIVGLLERWYQPTSGQMILDDHDIADYNTAWLRSNLRLVQQEPTLFQGTVAQNVAKGFVGTQMTLPEEKRMQLIQEACIAADAHEFILGLPDGYHTALGEGARMLSGGQRQRIAIARSIISEPRILLCDEATSALDSRAEKAVQSALDRVSANKTTLIIAHKLATVMAADNIAVMANGQVVEQGSHHELLERDGLYAAMVRAQDLGAELEEGAPSRAPEVAPQEHENHGEYGSSAPTLMRMRSEYKATEPQSKVEPLTAGTLNQSLFSCAFVMLKENKDLYPWYALSCLAYVMVGGTYAVQAVLFSRLIRVFTLQGAEARNQADFYALMLFVLALANLVGFFCVGLATNAIGQSLTYRYRKEMLQRILNMDLDFFDFPENASGALTARLSSVPSATQELMSQNLGLMLNVVVNVITSSALAIAYGWKLGLTLVFTGLPLIVASGWVRVRLDQRLDASTEKQFSSSASLASEAVISIRTVSLLTLENDVLREYSECLDGIVAKVIRSLLVTLIPYSFSQSADFLVMALGFWYGSRLLSTGEYTSTQFFVVFIAIIFGDQAAAQFFTWTTSITKATSGTNYMLWLRTITTNIRETAENQDKAPSAGDVSVGLHDVEFRYRQRQTAIVLRSISLTIKPGTFAAFVGPSGCGKSTIVSLMQRFYDPSSGCITVNEDDIKLLSPSLYRRCMSLVQQEPPLYLGSVRQNIALGLDYEPSEEEMAEACRQANVLDFVSSLPQGLDTPCGSKGTQFSGGQRQRIALARALIRKPRLLLLDEATSALDTQSEKVVQKALDEAMSSRTTVAVAHRLSTIRDADVIFVIQDGAIAESGTHRDLQRRKGRYYAMCLAQSFGESRLA
ncbi:hypothetical protein BAUCODRAFT_148201 [Baudoinia panamericana UAMH 10762]|uniref:ABC transporter n=1 Tax=Baudoinia panamericana (strain UAMH 10762) TaxID=717646 RepID=M2NBT8_BAUPA|nr:uncharacterized protein BAUCODRAFT_148201 [Baudoinia panamericana UAMH 10762]EMC96619.1 hypothetical protein BAUCODRAFT_148201 [Baudoinia panamericana UAMH 10762]